MVEYIGKPPTTQFIYELLFRLLAEQNGVDYTYEMDIIEKDGTKKRIKGSTKDNPYLLKEK